MLSDLYNPELNVRYGAWYLHHLLQKYGGDERLALAAYNAGQKNVDTWRARGRGHPVPGDARLRRARRAAEGDLPAHVRERARARLSTWASRSKSSARWCRRPAARAGARAVSRRRCATAPTRSPTHDVAALDAAGLSEDEIFEQTVAAAIAEGLRRLDAGLRGDRMRLAVVERGHAPAEAAVLAADPRAHAAASRSAS